MFIVGLTGGIASGKSTVAERFARHGVPVIDADALARQVVEPGQPALARLIETFGGDILDPNGRLDREGLRRRVFADPDQRRALDRIMHPAIGLAMQQALRAAEGPYVILMVPLLVETGQHRMVNRVLVVDVPEAVQIERLMARDGSDADQAAAILAAQASRAQRLAAAHDIVNNSGLPEALDAAIDRLHAAYSAMAVDPAAREHRLSLP
ncbi:MAG: dephospho-CoA kinase [Pseudomonadota bacterium]